MRLKDVMRELPSLDDGLTICAREPWTGDSEMTLVRVDSMSKLPDWIVSSGLKYFLEVSVAREILEIPEAQSLRDTEKLRLLIYYASNDAYPRWVFEK